MQQLSSSRRELLDFLDNAELDYPVEKWEIDGVLVWPLIKIDLFFRHVNAENRDEALDKRNQKRKVSFYSKIVRIIISFFRFILLYLKRKKPIVAFFSDSAGHRVIYNDAFVNRYFKPITDFLESEDRSFNYLTINDDTANLDKYPSQEPNLFVHKYYLGARLWRTLFISKRKVHTKLEGYFEFVTRFEDTKLAYLQVGKNYRAHIQRKIDSVLAFSSIVQILIKKHTPKVIFELCYYSTLRLGINHAAFRAGVRTVEIQHGGIGRDHVSYSGWGKVPHQGYSVFPQTFWLWDESSKQLIERWRKGHHYHVAVLGGNPWLSYVKENNDALFFPKNRSIILYTLQYSDIPKHVIDAIKFTPPHFQWWIRLHPRKLESKSIIDHLLNDNGIDSDCYEIEKATSYPLPAILRSTYVHLSGSSGAIIEAAEMGVFSLILEEIGTIYYADLISEGKAKATLDTNAILKAVLAVAKTPNLNESTVALYKPLVKRLIPSA